MEEAYSLYQCGCRREALCGLKPKGRSLRLGMQRFGTAGNPSSKHQQQWSSSKSPTGRCPLERRQEKNLLPSGGIVSGYSGVGETKLGGTASEPSVCLGPRKPCSFQGPVCGHERNRSGATRRTSSWLRMVVAPLTQWPLPAPVITTLSLRRMEECTLGAFMQIPSEVLPNQVRPSRRPRTLVLVLSW